MTFHLFISAKYGNCKDKFINDFVPELPITLIYKYINQGLIKAVGKKNADNRDEINGDIKVLFEETR